MWDGNRWQQLCQIDKCLKRDQKSQGVCLIHYREQLENSKKKLERKSRRTGKKLNLVCSSLTRQQMSDLELFSTRFGARLSSHVDEKTTHLIASEVESRVCCLTKKVFFAVGFHKFVIGFQWIVDCLAKETLLNEENYEIQGDSSLSSDHNGMQRSRLTRQPIFKSYPYAIAVECAIGCQQGMFTRDELENLVELSGAILIRNVQQDSIESHRTLIVLCDDDDKNVVKKYENLKVKYVFVIPEFFLDSIVLYEVQPIKSYELIFS